MESVQPCERVGQLARELNDGSICSDLIANRINEHP